MLRQGFPEWLGDERNDPGEAGLLTFIRRILGHGRRNHKSLHRNRRRGAIEAPLNGIQRSVLPEREKQRHQSIALLSTLSLDHLMAITLPVTPKVTAVRKPTSRREAIYVLWACAQARQACMRA